MTATDWKELLDRIVAAGVKARLERGEDLTAGQEQWLKEMAAVLESREVNR